jgi:hypothetical protein
MADHSRALKSMKNDLKPTKVHVFHLLISSWLEKCPITKKKSTLLFRQIF